MKYIIILCVVGVIFFLCILFSGLMAPLYWKPTDIIIGSTGGYYDDPIYLKIPTFTKTWEFYSYGELLQQNCKQLHHIWNQYFIHDKDFIGLQDLMLAGNDFGFSEIDNIQKEKGCNINEITND